MSQVHPRSETQKRLMAMAAMYVEETYVLDELAQVIRPSEDDHDLVMAEVDDYFLRLDMNFAPEVKVDCLEILQEIWHVVDRDSALKALKNLREQGQRDKFKQLAQFTNDITKFKQLFLFEFAHPEEVQIDDKGFQSLAEWLKKASSYVPECGILAWDVARYVHLVRLCFMGQILEAEECWQQVDLIEPLVEGQFKDWMQFSQSYLIGLTFWSGQEDPYIKASCERLLGYEVSPWKFYPWSEL